MKYMILTYASQQDYDGMAGQASDQPAWLPEDFAAMGTFMEAFNNDLAASGDWWRRGRWSRPCTPARVGPLQAGSRS